MDYKTKQDVRIHQLFAPFLITLLVMGSMAVSNRMMPQLTQLWAAEAYIISGCTFYLFATWYRQVFAPLRLYALLASAVPLLYVGIGATLVGLASYHGVIFWQCAWMVSALGGAALALIL